MEFITNDDQGTKKIAIKLVESLAQKKDKSALVFGLTGELGVGKTTFVQGLAKALKVKERVLSPTFVIMKHFNILTFKHFNNLYHIDCYRIEKPEELLALGFEEIIKEPKNLVVIEWAEKVKKILPKDMIWLEIKHLGEDKRKIKITKHKTYNT